MEQPTFYAVDNHVFRNGGAACAWQSERNVFFSQRNANLCSKSPPKSNQIIYYRKVHDRFLRETCGVSIRFLACIVLELLCSEDCAHTDGCHSDA